MGLYVGLSRLVDGLLGPSSAMAVSLSGMSVEWYGGLVGTYGGLVGAYDSSAMAVSAAPVGATCFGGDKRPRNWKLSFLNMENTAGE